MYKQEPYCYFIMKFYEYGQHLENKFVIYPIPVNKINAFKNVLDNQNQKYIIEYDISKFQLNNFELIRKYKYLRYVDLTRLFLKIKQQSYDLQNEYYLNLPLNDLIDLLNITTIQYNNININTEITFSTNNYKDYKLNFT